jgi:tetratricopeptide (TPR) repeat protein
MVRPGAQVTEEQIESFARSHRGVVGQVVGHTEDLVEARAAMGRVLAWRDHLFAAGTYDPAGEIVSAVFDVLARWGERDRAKALLRGCIETVESANKAVAQSNLATLLAEEGKLAEALGAKQQMAAVLSTTAIIYQNQGNYDKAIEYEERSLALEKERENEEGQAISLHQLSMLYRFKEDYAAALARSQESEALFRKRNIESHVAATLHEQGIIHIKIARAAATGDEAAAHRAAAGERFEASLAISRRIENQADAADTLSELGKLWMDAGQMREAIAAFTKALEIDQRLGRPAKVGLRLEFLGTVHEDQGQYAAALEKYQQALELARKFSSPQEQAIVERHIARVRGKMGNG